MPPKFQSTFIPSGPASSASAPSYSSSTTARRKHRDLFSFLAGTFFTLSVLLAMGVFGYKTLLNYRIDEMGAELESARAAIDPAAVTELIRLNARLVSTGSLIQNHRIISPVFDFLESATPQTVRYTEFNFSMTPNGLDLTLRGQAQSYAALAAAAEVYSRSNSNFRNPTFSSLQLDDQGNVVFGLQMEVEPGLLSYERLLEKIAPTVPATGPGAEPAGAPETQGVTPSSGAAPQGQ